MAHLQVESKVIKNFGLHEYFINIQTHIFKPADRKGLAKKDVRKRVEKAFMLIKAHILDKGKGGRGLGGHTAIRKLRKVFKNPKAHIELDEALVKTERPEKFDGQEILDGFENALDIVKFYDEKNQPKKLIKRAISALDSIDINSDFFKSPDVTAALKELSEKVSVLLEKSSE